MSKIKTQFLVLFLIIISLLGYQNCGPSKDGSTSPTVLNGTSTGTPSKAEVFLEFYSYEDLLNDLNEPVNVTDLIFCFRKIQLEGPGGEQNIFFENNEVLFSPQGTAVPGMTIPPGEYHEIKYELRGEGCDSGQSISFKNGNGSFAESEEIELEFEGEITITGNSNQSIKFLMDQLIVALDRVRQANQIKPFLEEITEEFDD